MRFASALLVFLWPVAAAAQSPGSCLLVTEPEPVEEKESAETQKALPDFVFKGFAATSYNLNFPKPANSRNLVRGYALDDRKLKLDGLNLDFEYGLSGDDQVGFRLDTVLPPACSATPPRVSLWSPTTIKVPSRSAMTRTSDNFGN